MLNFISTLNNEPIPVTVPFPVPIPMESPTVATFKKYEILHDYVKNITVKDKRKIFADMRTATIKLSADTLFPQYGLVAGEFATFAVLTENVRKKE